MVCYDNVVGWSTLLCHSPLSLYPQWWLMGVLFPSAAQLVLDADKEYPPLFSLCQY